MRGTAGGCPPNINRFHSPSHPGRAPGGRKSCFVFSLLHPFQATSLALDAQPPAKKKRKGKPFLFLLIETANPASPGKGVREVGGLKADTETGVLVTESQAQCAFKNLKTHEVLQFALRIASSCALHRTREPMRPPLKIVLKV